MLNNQMVVVPDLAAKQTSRRFNQKKSSLKTIQLLAEGWMLEKTCTYMYVFIYIYIIYTYIYIYSIHVLISCCHLNGTSKSALGTAFFAEELAEHNAIWPKSRKKGDKMVAARHPTGCMGWVGRGYGDVSQNDLLVYDNRKLAVGHCVSLEKYDELWWFIEMGIEMGGGIGWGMGIWGMGMEHIDPPKSSQYNDYNIQRTHMFWEVNHPTTFFLGGVQLKSFPLPPPGRHVELSGY